jgi:hypothetical protein
VNLDRQDWIALGALFIACAVGTCAGILFALWLAK